ncbi:MAG: hypothetical protein LBI49_17660, partial [Nocardiopsaceae bacterium]|nr:hypothetical protein [Nocardiopsaceae bacterium]
MTGTGAAAATASGRVIIAAVQQFLLFYGGVFALIALSAAVAVGLVATDRIIMSPGTRIAAQAVHRTVSLAAVGFLAVHIALEIVAARSHMADSVVPFLARNRTLYVGLGTIGSDLMVVIAATGALRKRFAGLRTPWMWRVIHASAYLAWVLSIVHGLLAGRTAKPYVDWSYGACVAVAALALTVRAVAIVRSRSEVAGQAVSPAPAGPGNWAALPAAAAAGMAGPGLAVPAAPARALPPGPSARAAAPPTASALDEPDWAGAPGLLDVSEAWQRLGEDTDPMFPPDQPGPPARLPAYSGPPDWVPADSVPPDWVPADSGPPARLPMHSGQPDWVPADSGPPDWMSADSGVPDWMSADSGVPDWRADGSGPLDWPPESSGPPGPPSDPPLAQSGPLYALPDGLDPTLDWLQDLAEELTGRQWPPRNLPGGDSPQRGRSRQPRRGAPRQPASDGSAPRPAAPPALRVPRALPPPPPRRPRALPPPAPP